MIFHIILDKHSFTTSQRSLCWPCFSASTRHRLVLYREWFGVLLGFAHHTLFQSTLSAAVDSCFAFALSPTTSLALLLQYFLSSWYRCIRSALLELGAILLLAGVVVDDFPQLWLDWNESKVRCWHFPEIFGQSESVYKLWSWDCLQILENLRKIADEVGVVLQGMLGQGWKILKVFKVAVFFSEHTEFTF